MDAEYPVVEKDQRCLDRDSRTEVEQLKWKKDLNRDSVISVRQAQIGRATL